MAKLVVHETYGQREFELVDREVAIGRELDNALRLSDPSVSRHHAVVRQGQDGFRIEDLQSSNGVLLNGARVPSAPLRDGDRITLGQMQLTFQDPAPASPAGTVRMDAEAMARFRNQTREPDPAEVTAPALAAPARAAGKSRTKPGPAFLHPHLPDIPDDAMPLVNPDGTLQRGDLRTRFLAALIDASPVLVLTLLVVLLTRGILALFAGLLMLADLALMASYLVFMPLFWMRCGASPGKKAMKLRVVPVGDPFGRIGLDAALLRMAGYLANAVIAYILRGFLFRTLPPPDGFGAWTLVLAVLTLAFGAVPYLLILRPDRRALEDLFSRSMVIKVDR